MSQEKVLLNNIDSNNTLNPANHIENAKVFKALCDPKRLAILEILRNGEYCACDLIEKTGIAQSALSYHMKILVDSTLVDSCQIGKWIHYKISENGKNYTTNLLKALLNTNEIKINFHCN